MQMTSIDWSTAPEGAEFYADTKFRKLWQVWVAHDNVWSPSIRKLHHLQEYEDYEENPEAQPTEWPAESRIEQIGQNGGDGLHYDEQREQHEAKHDPVNNPKHYAIAPGVEAIDIIKASLTPEQFRGYLLGNFLKYRLRAGDKGDLQQDIDKSNWYRERLNNLK